MLNRQTFLQASESEQNIFISRLLHAVRNDDTYFLMAHSIIQNAALDGLYNDVKFGNEIYNNDAEKDLHVGELSNQHT